MNSNFVLEYVLEFLLFRHCIKQLFNQTQIVIVRDMCEYWGMLLICCLVLSHWYNSPLLPLIWLPFLGGLLVWGMCLSFPWSDSSIDFCNAVLWNVAIAMIFRLWLHNLVPRSSFHDTLSELHCLDAMFASKLKTLSTCRGHSNPHLHVPLVCRYWRIWSEDVRHTPLGLKVLHNKYET